MTQLEYFRVVAPDYAAMSDADVLIWIQIAEGLSSTAALDDETAALAVAFYAAHMIYVAGLNGASGAVMSEREGDLARSYQPLAGNAGWLGTSSYGKSYMHIVASNRGGNILTRMS